MGFGEFQNYLCLEGEMEAAGEGPIWGWALNVIGYEGLTNGRERQPLPFRLHTIFIWPPVTTY